MSLTTDVFGIPRPGYYRVYYIIEKPQELEKALAKQHPVVLMFSANWNKPSKVMLTPFWDMAVAKRNEAVFCQLNVDQFPEMRDILAKYKVEALPTFLLMKEQQEKARVVGAKVDELNKNIKSSILSSHP